MFLEEKMGFLEIFLIGISLAMDAFAMSVCKGLSMKKVRMKDALLIAVYFGGFQALMPFLGWLLGTGFEKFIVSVDHWIAFVLLAIVGGKMLWDGIKGEDECDVGGISHKELLMLAVATSIDALAMGITFGVLGVQILSTITVIGLTTFVICLCGVYLGKVCGSKFQQGAKILGGAVLILIGLRILLNHLGVIAF